jgi:hypothetical protein
LKCNQTRWFSLGTTCSGQCDQPGNASNPNAQWTLGDPVVTGTSTDTYTDTSSSQFNQAEVASGGKASDKNQSNFKVTTTTTTVVSTTTADAQWTNPGGGNPPPKTETTTTVTYDSQTTDLGKKTHIKPTHP